MASAAHEVRIDRPITEVFDFLADGTNNPRWQPLVVTSIGPEGPVGPGATFTQRVRSPLGFTVSANYRVIAYEPSQKLSMTVTSGGPIRPTITYTLTAEDQATIVRCVVEYRPAGLARLTAPLFVLLHPLFAWEASCLERVGPALESA